MAEQLPGPGPSTLSALPAGRSQQRLAGGVMLTSALVFLTLAPFAQVQLPKVWAFIPAYESALIVNDLVTAALLAGQFMIGRTQALRVLLCGYLFTGLMASAHLLSFPALFAPAGLLGGDTQTTAWLYMFWHAGFPLVVLAYTRWPGEVARDHGTRRALGAGMAAAAAAALALVLLTTTEARRLLPAIMDGNRYTPAMIGVVSVVWLLSLVALVELWRRRSPSVLDWWLRVVMCAWLCDIALSAVFNAGRFDLGFYAGRVYGLLAASFVLIVLLVENGWLYARLLDTASELQRLMSANALTGIANRRAFDEALEREWRRAQRGRAPLALLMVDVDHFKQFNDFYGHVAGDDCLRQLATVLARMAQRAGEMAARYGGEEFVVLLPGIDADEAARMAQRICQAVTQLDIAHAQSPTAQRVTVSIGAACVCPGVEREALANPTSLIQRADAALYAAKLEGRNRARVARDDDNPGRPAAALRVAG
ncbi:MAG TPA: sensor domain-containing diguanylate cyclase [Ideonella sp.]|nr:sensor domain-containing diguanylate cyclase [Ideonella sp.]